MYLFRIAQTTRSIRQTGEAQDRAGEDQGDTKSTGRSYVSNVMAGQNYFGKVGETWKVG